MRTTLTLLLFTTGLTACGGPFAVARREGTADAYKRFVANHPQHAKVPKAVKRAEALDWEGAVAADTSTAYALYVVAHPTGEHVAEARERGDGRAWSEAREEGTLAAYQGYLSAYPEGAHATDATHAIEDLVVEEARYADSVEAWGRYMFRYPEGRYIDEARAKRDARGWETAQQGNSRVAYEAYLTQHPNGEHRQEARDWLASLAVHTLQPVLVIGTTWRPEWARRGDRARLQRAFERGLLADAKTRFAMRPVVVEDAVTGDLAHPADRHGREPGVGLFVVEVSEDVGRTFEPSGHATTLPTVVSIYVAPTDEPLWSYTFTARTPDSIYGSTEESLYTEAVEAWGDLLRGVPVPAEQLLTPEIP
jgi:hypothetical protein